MIQRAFREQFFWMALCLVVPFGGCAKPIGTATPPPDAQAGRSGSTSTRGGSSFVPPTLVDAGSTFDARLAPLSVDGPTCGITTAPLSRLPPEILLVLDRSPSMIEETADGPACQTRTCGTRWEEVTTALAPALEETQSGINWGLKTFPDDAVCLVKDGATVEVAPNNALTITDAYTSNPPVTHQGYTPTRDALLKAAAYLKSRTTLNPKSILLATDGEPNCASAAEPGRATPDATVQAVADVAAMGIPVYVVGVDTAATRTNDTLNQMAIKGGRPRNASTKYYAVDTAEDLTVAMDAIASAAVTCTFALPKAPPVPDNVAVEIDGQRVPRDASHASGWDYGAGVKSVELYGEVCARVRTGTAGNVTILFGCPEVPIP
jgi:hypothetical protein